MLLHDQSPEQACRPIVDIHPSFIPYRDAGFGPSTYSLSILDCLQGLRKGLDLGLLRLDQFDVKEYEHYECVSNGDFNWITPSFIAFAGPTDKMKYDDLQAAIAQRALRHPHGTPSESDTTSYSSSGSTPSPSNTSSRSATPSSIHSSKPCSKVHTPIPQAISEDKPPSPKNMLPASETLTPPLSASHSLTSEKVGDSSSSSTTTSQKIKKKRSRLSKSFQSVLDYFEKRNIKAVIRLNDKTYDATHFTARAIEHQDMIYPDGTCPPWFIVRHFLAVCEDIIEKGGVVAVHCKAGLGRTGTLIAVYLMKTYGMTAREVIAYLRLMRPGSVVGPQQNWLEENESRILSWYDGTASNMISPVGAPASSPVIEATPATDYDQVFSRANSSGLESTWSEAENSYEDEDDEDDDDDDVDARRNFALADLISHQGNASSQDSLMTMDMDMGGSMKDESEPMWIEDILDDLDKPSLVRVLPGPSPVRVYEHPLNLSQSLASVTDSIMDEIELDKAQKAAVETTLDADMDTSPHQEHIGNKDYTIPIQPRKHAHHTHHLHENHETTAMSSATMSTSNSSLATPSSLKDDGEDYLSVPREASLLAETTLFPHKSVEMSEALGHNLQENSDHTLEQLNMLRRQRQHPHVEPHNREPAR